MGFGSRAQDSTRDEKSTWKCWKEYKRELEAELKDVEDEIKESKKDPMRTRTALVLD